MPAPAKSEPVGAPQPAPEAEKITPKQVEVQPDAQDEQEELYSEKIEITKKDDHTVIKTRINQLDLRPALAAIFGKKKDETAAPKAPAENQDKEDLGEGKLRVLDFYIDIRQMLLPGDVAIENINSFFVYEDYKGNEKDEGIFPFISNLGSSVGSTLLIGVKRLKFDGQVVNGSKKTDISINIAPIDSKQRAILIRSGDINAMMQMIGIENFEDSVLKGSSYVMHAKWIDGDTDKEDWAMTGTIQLKEFYITKPSLMVRALGGTFSLRGLVSSVTSNRIYFEKMEFLFKIKKNKREIYCKVYFGPETSVPCGKF